MTLDDLSTSVSTIVQDTVHKLASLAPSEIETVLYHVRRRWPDDDEIVEQIRHEATWIMSQVPQHTGDTQE